MDTELDVDAPQDQEVFGTDDRTLVADPMLVPNRWVCAIDLFIDDPQRGKGVPLQTRDARGTGILVGPRHVLTARHVLDPVKLTVDGHERRVAVARVRVSPARHGDNGSHPLGQGMSSRYCRSRPYIVPTRKFVGGHWADVPIQFTDDYALIILEQDLDPGAQGWWGKNPAQAALRRLDPAGLGGRKVVVLGYPGDRCGTRAITGANAAEMDRRMAYCIRTEPDKWASTQWRASGTVDVDGKVSRMFHTADTSAGQSGGPICLSNGGVLDLLGVHHGAAQVPGGTLATRNEGVRVTRRMLGELCAWINKDAGRTRVEVKNDTLLWL